MLFLRIKAVSRCVRTFNIRYNYAQKVKSVIKEYLSDYAIVSVLEDRNILFVEDTSEHISRVSTILKSIDDNPDRKSSRGKSSRLLCETAMPTVSTGPGCSMVVKNDVRPLKCLF